MTDAEQKAVDLVNDSRRRNFLPVLSAQTITGSVSFPALRCAIEDHERFRQEVSDAIDGLFSDNGGVFVRNGLLNEKLSRFIITKPDPLVEVMIDCGFISVVGAVDDMRAALAKRGLEIREKK